MHVVPRVPDLPHGLIGRSHRVIEARADQFQFARPPQVPFLEVRRQFPPDPGILRQALQLSDNELVPSLFLASLHPAKADMGQDS